MTMAEDGGGFYEWPPKPKPKATPAPVTPAPAAPPVAPDTAVSTTLRHSVTISAPTPVFKKRTP